MKIGDMLTTTIDVEVVPNVTMPKGSKVKVDFISSDNSHIYCKCLGVFENCNVLLKDGEYK